MLESDQDLGAVMGECTAPNNRLELLTELLRISISFLVSTTEFARIREITLVQL